MRNRFPPALAIAALIGLMAASPPVPTPAPPQPPQAPEPPACVLPNGSADYVPGRDARNRAVAPADVPDAGVQVSTEIYAELRTRNPKLKGAGVFANLPGLQTRPLCPPAPPAAKGR